MIQAVLEPEQTQLAVCTRYRSGGRIPHTAIALLSICGKYGLKNTLASIVTKEGETVDGITIPITG